MKIDRWNCPPPQRRIPFVFDESVASVTFQCAPARAPCAVELAVSPRRIAGLVDRTCELESRAVGAALRSDGLACMRTCEEFSLLELLRLFGICVELVAPETPPTPFCRWPAPALGLAGRWKIPVRRRAW